MMKSREEKVPIRFQKACDRWICSIKRFIEVHQAHSGANSIKAKCVNIFRVPKMKERNKNEGNKKIKINYKN